MLALALYMWAVVGFISAVRELDQKNSSGIKASPAASWAAYLLIGITWPVCIALVLLGAVVRWATRIPPP